MLECLVFIDDEGRRKYDEGEGRKKEGRSTTMCYDGRVASFMREMVNDQSGVWRGHGCAGTAPDPGVAMLPLVWERGGGQRT